MLSSTPLPIAVLKGQLDLPTSGHDGNPVVEAVPMYVLDQRLSIFQDLDDAQVVHKRHDHRSHRNSGRAVGALRQRRMIRRRT